MTRKIVCIVFFGVIIDLSWKLWQFPNYLDVSSRAIPNVVGVILGGLTGVAIFQSARFFEERRVKHILHLLGTAALVDTCAALIGYAGIQTFRWSLLLVGLGLELLGALFCISILLKSRVSQSMARVDLREPEKKQTNITPQTYTRSYNVNSQFGFVLGLVVAAIPLLIASLPLGRGSNQITTSALRVSSLGLLLLGCVMEFVAPSKRWKLAFAVGLGMPAAVLIRLVLTALIDKSVSHLMLMMPIFVAGAILFGPLAAFTGVILGFTIKGILKRK